MFIPRFAGSVFSPGDQIILTGSALDAEDGAITGTDLTWTVDGKSAGSGEETAIRDLTPGAHIIELTAVDSDGSKGSSSVEILLPTNYTFLPVIMANQ